MVYNLILHRRLSFYFIFLLYLFIHDGDDVDDQNV